MKRRWILREVSPQDQMALSSLLTISPIMASVLLARGVLTEKQAHEWLSADGASVRDPFLLPDMERAVDRLRGAVRTGERVCFYGDYDVDGMAATSVYLDFFRGRGADTCWYIPDRVQEGYGLNTDAIGRLAREGVTLLVTSDCGTTSHAEIDHANALGMDAIITDHHQGDGELPRAVAVLNPHRSDSLYPFSGFCSAGLAYRVALAYCMKYGEGACPVNSLLDLVALATVADIVPLHDENRRDVRDGLALMSHGSRCGIRALKQVAGVDRPCTSDTVAFRLAPRINAAGRLAHAALGVELLTTGSEARAMELTVRLEELNRDRQRLEEDISAEAVAGVTSGDDVHALIVWARHWHVGVIGIVAARLVERYHCPAVVIAVNEQGIGKGSARSVPGFDLYRALAECRPVLQGFGGHPMAAGLTIEESRLAEFRERFTHVAALWRRDQPRDPVLHVDAEVSLQDVAPRLVRELERLHPFGAGNPEPTLAVRNLNVLESRVVGDRHLKLTVRQPRSLPFESIGFRMGQLADQGVVAGQAIDLAFMPELQRWNGFDRVQLRIRDIRLSEPV